ncbi:MAG: YdhR family protein [Aphanocapsa sp. GSE-SYN-MK-11-07L]|jgi:dsDNA-binding SOS-regulon protein|nr:YdhR family protein [Aphanocapsa sp. GSE-SYN-MK-11-07L]
MQQFSSCNIIQKLLSVALIGMTLVAGYLTGIINSTKLPLDNRVKAQAATISSRILQINFKYTTSTSDFKKQMLDVAPHLASVKGLKWKIWSIDETNQEASGYYLFENETTLNAYLKNVFFVGMENNTTVNNIVVKKFEILEEPTAMTRGPIGKN